MLVIATAVCVLLMLALSWFSPALHARELAGSPAAHLRSVASALVATTGRSSLGRLLAYVVTGVELLLGVLLTLFLSGVDELADPSFVMVVILFGSYAAHTAFVLRSRVGSSCGCSSDEYSSANRWTVMRALTPMVLGLSILVFGSPEGVSTTTELVLAVVAGASGAVVLWALPDAMTETRPKDIYDRTGDFVAVVQASTR